MKDMISLHKVVDFAIRRGSTSLSYYTDCASSLPDEGLATFFETLREHEVGQQGRLFTVKTMLRSRSSELHVPFRRISEYMVDLRPVSQKTGIQALLWSLIRTETSQKLYERLGEYVEEGELKVLFLSMADEECKRKRLIEACYDHSLMDAIHV